MDEAREVALRQAVIASEGVATPGRIVEYAEAFYAFLTADQD